MKTLLIAHLLAAAALSAQFLIPTPAPPPPAPARVVADTLIEGVNAGLADRIGRLKNLWETLWENDRATPAEILAELGPRAVLLFQAAGAARADLENMAAIAGTTAAELLGDAKYLSTPVPVTIHADGRVTINPD